MNRENEKWKEILDTNVNLKSHEIVHWMLNTSHPIYVWSDGMSYLPKYDVVWMRKSYITSLVV